MNIADAARDRLLAYCSLTNEKFLTPPHIVRIAKALEAVERGEIKRLIISVPPRHGKSMLTSRLFPAWYFGRNPEKKIIFATYNSTYGDEFGTSFREQVNSPEFKALFPKSKLKVGSQRKDFMEAATGEGTYAFTGVGGSITGRGAHLFVCDDLIKDREEADSQLMRDKAWSWFSGVASSRMEEGGSIVVIMTRWHEDDIIARIRQNLSHEKWVEIKLPALNEDGSSLWPERYSAEYFHNYRINREYDFQCLYQQDPIPAAGIIVKPEWMPRGFQKDGYSAIMIGVDPAVGLKEHNDETAICVGGLGYGETPMIDEIETIYGHWTMDEIMENIDAIARKYRANLVGIENVAAQEWLVQQCIKRGINAVPVPTHGKDKVARFMGVSHFMNQKRVNVNSAKLREQGLRFRGGSEKNDLWDAFVIMMILIRDYTIERNKHTELSSEQSRFLKDGVPMSSHDAWRIQTKELRQKKFENPFGDVQEFNKTNFQTHEDFY